jgi:hypothetical protein
MRFVNGRMCVVPREELDNDLKCHGSLALFESGSFIPEQHEMNTRHCGRREGARAV